MGIDVKPHGLLALQLLKLHVYMSPSQKYHHSSMTIEMIYIPRKNILVLIRLWSWARIYLSSFRIMATGKSLVFFLVEFYGVFDFGIVAATALTTVSYWISPDKSNVLI